MERKELVLEEVKAFLDRSNEDKTIFTAKVFVTNDVLVSKLSEDTKATYDEYAVVLLADTPNGQQVAYNNIISVPTDATDEEAAEIIKAGFPTKEAIEEARAKAQVQADAKAKFQQEMENLNPAEMAEMLSQGVDGLDDGLDVGSEIPETGEVSETTTSDDTASN